MHKANIINLGIQIVPKSKTLDTYALVDKAIEVIQQSGVNQYASNVFNWFYFTISQMLL